MILKTNYVNKTKLGHKTDFVYVCVCVSILLFKKHFFLHHIF